MQMTETFLQVKLTKPTAKVMLQIFNKWKKSLAFYLGLTNNIFQVRYKVIEHFWRSIIDIWGCSTLTAKILMLLSKFCIWNITYSITRLSLKIFGKRLIETKTLTLLQMSLQLSQSPQIVLKWLTKQWMSEYTPMGIRHTSSRATVVSFWISNLILIPDLSNAVTEMIVRS